MTPVRSRALPSAYCDIESNRKRAQRKPPVDAADRSRFSRGMWMTIGWISVALGGIGVVVPGLPTTGFMVFAASCFAKSSPRFEQWILDLPGVGPHVRAYRDGDGMPKRAKITALAMMTAAVTFAAGFVITILWIRIVVVVAGLIGWWFLLFQVPTTAPIPDPA